ncbi:hypothetical protein GCK72_022178 [Caenorhabditis remanei]|uniref:Uncharacterized protein n=1 Tax=Caenorhabditis remanei TaxID=31234 RepID=A0A6A5FTM0_CAERE|nr:hypothetical protein GCK72_022178 [Caenorhabditis remanei]KAF1745731.1 hypothetical protein GCK72_022178 [Caenorhabditis remanei]
MRKGRILGFLKIIGVVVTLLHKLPDAEDEEEAESESQNNSLEDQFEIAWIVLDVNQFVGLKKSNLLNSLLSLGGTG